MSHHIFIYDFYYVYFCSLCHFMFLLLCYIMYSCGVPECLVVLSFFNFIDKTIAGLLLQNKRIKITPKKAGESDHTKLYKIFSACPSMTMVD